MGVILRWKLPFSSAALMATLLAAPADRALSEYQKQDWHVDDGLPQGNVRTIVQSPAGSLLIGTGGGMVGFDGLRFKPVKVDDRDDNANEPVNALLYARNGDLWIGTDGRGVIHRSNGRSVNVSESAGLTQERVRSIFEASPGIIWVATQNGIERITVVNGEYRVECLSALGIVPGDLTEPFAPDGRGGLFIVSGLGVFHTNGVSAPKAIALDTTALGSPTAIHRDPRGNVWVGTQTGAFRLVNKDGRYEQIPVPGVHGPVAIVLADREGDVWFGSRGQGICRLSPSGLVHWNIANGLADNTLRTMFEDNEGNLWIGMLSGGLTRWRQTALLPFGQPEGLPESFAATVLSSRAGDLWFGTWGKGVLRLHQGKLMTVPLPGTPAQSPIRSMAEDRNGGVWIGTWYNGIYHADVNGQEVRVSRRYLTGTESTANAASALLVDDAGALWVGTYRGLLKYDRGIPEPGSQQTLLPGKLITCLLMAPSGELYVGTSGGLYMLYGGVVTSLTQKNGLSNDAILSVSADSQGSIWVGTKAGGLDRIEGHTITHIPASSGLPSYVVYSVIDDRRGNLWMGSARGVLRVSRNQLIDYTEGRAKNLDVAVLGKSDGMRSSECGGMSQPPAARGTDGSIWFATAKGFAHTNISQPPIPNTAPAPSIASLSVDHTPIPLTAPVGLAPGAVNVDIDFDGIRLSDPGRLQFRYKLENYDADWTYTRQRRASYKRLPPGRYRFAVAVRDRQGPWSAQNALVDFEQRPFFYQRWWFYGLLVALLSAAIALAFRWRVGLAKSRVALVLEERGRIARDWHDTLMADFAAISWQLEATRNRLGPVTAEAVASLDLTRTMVKHCQAEARRIIWDLRASEEPVGLLSSELAKALTILGPRAEQETRLRIEGEERPLPPVCVHHLVCIGQEAVANALRHGAPQAVEIQLVYSAERIVMRVQDDGGGFEMPTLPPAQPGHFGLAVMHERARKLGGELTIVSSPGEGTEVSVDIPSPAAA